MHKGLYSILLCALILITYTGLYAVSKHHQTTADPKTGELLLQVMDREISINLQSPATRYTTYPDGQLQHVEAVIVSDYYEIDFYHQEYLIKEKVSLFQSYSVASGYKILEGVSYSFDYDGDVITEANWSKGKLDGFQRIYHSETGKILEEREYVLNYPVNHWVSYYPSGAIASEIQFPSSNTDWLATEVVSPTKGPSNSLLTASYPCPFLTTQIWYYPDGTLLKKKQFSLYKHQNYVVVIDDGIATSYDRYGRLVKEQNTPKGNGEVVISISGYGRKYTEKTTWFNDAIFKVVQTQEALRD